MKHVKEPPAKRVLFQKGPALKSRLETWGLPGRLHYETSEVYEDHPKNILAAAEKALDPGIVSEAEKDTALLLKLFENAAAEAEEESMHAPRSNGEAIENKSKLDSENTRQESLSLICDEDELDEEGVPGAESRPAWYAATEKQALELCARSLYVISNSTRRNGNSNPPRKRRKHQLDNMPF